MGQGMIRVDRGDGRLFNFQPNDVDAFIKANPGAKVVERDAVGGPTEAETAATEAQTVNLGRMNLNELRAYADEHGVDLEGVSVKADIVERIEAAESKPQE